MPFLCEYSRACLKPFPSLRPLRTFATKPVSNPRKPFWRHLYRALLRSVSYLPDSLVRRTHAKHIRGRFEHYGTRVRSGGSEGRANFARQQNHLASQARKLLSKYERAYHGQHDALLWVMNCGYGQRGKSRHDQLEHIKQFYNEKTPLNTNPSGKLKPHSRPRFNDGNSARHEARASRLSEAELMLAKRQVQNTLKLKSGQDSNMVIKSINTPLPEKNIWGRMMPIRRIRNARRKQDTKIQQRIIPPFTQAQTDRLVGLVNGKMKVEYVRQRRTRVGAWAGTEGNRVDVVRDKLQRRFVENPRRGITPRVLRRIYQSILERSETIVPPSDPGGQWTFVRHDKHLGWKHDLKIAVLSVT